MHDVGKVDPLITRSIPILGRVRLRARDLADIHTLWVIRGPYKHRWLAVPRARRLATQSTGIQMWSRRRLRVCNARLHDMNVAAGATRLSLLDIT